MIDNLKINLNFIGIDKTLHFYCQNTKSRKLIGVDIIPGIIETMKTKEKIKEIKADIKQTYPAFRSLFDDIIQIIRYSKNTLPPLSNIDNVLYQYFKWSKKNWSIYELLSFLQHNGYLSQNEVIEIAKEL